VQSNALIVGAGPVGLTAALVLARRGFEVTVVEASEQPNAEWRASTFHAPTLEMGAELGIVDEMLARGLRAPTYQIWDRRSGLIAEFDFGVLADETPYPFRLQLEQYKYVALLSEHLASLSNVRLLYGHQVRAVSQNQDSVQVTADTRDGPVAMHARWLLGADGARSTVRSSLRVAFTGMTYEHRYLLISVDAPLEEHMPGLGRVNYMADPEEHLMLLRIPDVWRVLLQVPDRVSDDAALSEQYGARRLELITGAGGELPVRHRQLYRVHQRVAERFHDNRVLLLGDAAHVNSPIGGMGLNSGIHDAYALGPALVAASHGDDAAIESWAASRRQVATADIQRISHRNTAELAERDEKTRWSRHHELAAIAGDPRRAKDWMREAAMLDSVTRQGLRPRAVRA
jgi:3-(3-hydroxy-phenyl)propionate hydroxylase